MFLKELRFSTKCADSADAAFWQLLSTPQLVDAGFKSTDTAAMQRRSISEKVGALTQTGSTGANSQIAQSLVHLLDPRAYTAVADELPVDLRADLKQTFAVVSVAAGFSAAPDDLHSGMKRLQGQPNDSLVQTLLVFPGGRFVADVAIKRYTEIGVKEKNVEVQQQIASICIDAMANLEIKFKSGEATIDVLPAASALERFEQRADSQCASIIDVQRAVKDLSSAAAHFGMTTSDDGRLNEVVLLFTAFGSITNKLVGHQDFNLLASLFDAGPKIKSFTSKRPPEYAANLFKKVV
jgi:hypothetical protein